MGKIGASVAIRSTGMSLVLGGVWLVGSMGIGSAGATISFPLPIPKGQGLPEIFMQTMTCQVGACSSSIRLVDTRDHDGEHVSGEQVGKDNPAQKHKADKSMKQQQGAKPRSSQPRGADDRRDLKEDQSTTSEAQDKRPDDRRYGGEHPTNP
ncbi:MAG: hypothetical protein JNN16_06875 [Nitrospira sp.]|nr:hypothetical protein [Nitrospira sp.]